MKQGYKIVEHTADAKIAVFGKTKEDLFKNALLGMNAILKATIRNKELRIKNIKIKDTDINALLVDFLSELNYLRQVNMEIYDNIKFTKFSDTELEGELSGYEANEFGEDIKAVTFHGLDVRKSKEGNWEAEIIFDI